MRIAISLSGDGFGHASRIGALSRELKKNHELFFWCPESVEPFLKSISSDGKVYSLPLIYIVKKGHIVKPFATVKKNIKLLLWNHSYIQELSRQLSSEYIDLVISDYEPFLAKAAKKSGIPVLLFNHQGVIEKCGGYSWEAIMARVANKFMMPYKNKIIVSSFYEGDVGPIIRDEIQNASLSKRDFILVYLKPSLKNKLSPILEQFKDVDIRIFPNKDEDFLEALTSCKGVISSAGHQLISECLVLKKPLLVIPEKGQYEQRLNGEMLEKSGWGKICCLNNIEACVRNFIEQIDKFPLNDPDPNIRYIFQDDTQNAVEKIEQNLKEILH